jgi:hypothetical protein
MNWEHQQAYSVPPKYDVSKADKTYSFMWALNLREDPVFPTYSFNFVTGGQLEIFSLTMLWFGPLLKAK